MPASRAQRGIAGQVFRWHAVDIESELPLGLVPSPGDALALLQLQIGVDPALAGPQGTLLATSAHTGYALYRDPVAGCWLAREQDRMHLSRAAIRVNQAPDSAGIEYLRNRALALWLHLVEMPPIHASAVARRGKAAALVGPSGAGKSTLAAAMQVTGYQLYADDLLPLSPQQGQVPVHVGGPQLRLWPDSAGRFHADASTLPTVTPDSAKLRLDIQSAADGAATLRAIFMLERGASDGAISIERLPGSRALLGLLGNGQMAGAAELLGLGASRMRICAEVLRSVAVYRLCYPTDFACLPEVCARLDALIQV